MNTHWSLWPASQSPRLLLITFFLTSMLLEGTIGTTIGSASILEAHNTKLMEFRYNVDNKDMVWLQKIKEEAAHGNVGCAGYGAECGAQPSLGQVDNTLGGRHLGGEISSHSSRSSDPSANRPQRGSGHGSPKSSQHSCQLLQSKDKLKKLALVVVENGSILRGTQSQAAAVPLLPASPTVFPKMSGNLPSSGKLVSIVEIGVSEQQTAEKCLVASKARIASQKLSFAHTLECGETSVPKQQVESLPNPASGTSSMVLPEAPKVKDTRSAQSVAKLWIAQPASPEDAAPVLTEPDGASPSL
ncbi:inner centromere protein-like [Notamacropus eugenii]|uniref:inner centromere protein-like n=1 Tax=Notamacropus eugenii TaxID=9315 RepID=UPI003B67B0ED